MKPQMIFLTIFLFACLFSACAEARPVNKVAAAAVQRETQPVVDAGLRARQVEGNNDAAFDLYRLLRSREGNLFYSPYSLSIALAMPYGGARGETERQMASALHYALPQDQLHSVFNAIDQSLSAAGSDDFHLSLANALWGQDGFPFRADFLALIARNYGAGVHLADFTSAGGRETARQEVNDWASRQTQDRVKDLLSSDMLNDSTRLVLVNAIYFKGKWQDPFLNGTSDAPFTRLDGQQVTISMMSRRAQAPYYQGEGFQAVALPYQGGRAEMVILLPDAGRFAQFEQAFDRRQMDAILAGLKSTDIKLYLPRFSFDFALDMKDTLGQLGMPAAFDPQGADFSGIYDKSKETRNLYLSHVAHKAYISVDEMGTEAAAASGILAEIVSEPVLLRVDRPFLFLILDRETGAYLFIGRVLNPK